jgi:nuclear GTP-binding protein
MDCEGQSPHNPRKRARSPSEVNFPTNSTDAITMSTDERPEHSRYTRQPKRMRRNKDIPEYDAPIDKNILGGMERGNPLSRKNLKKESKRAKKGHKVKMGMGEIEKGEGVGGQQMEVDYDDEFSFTFKA